MASAMPFAEASSAIPVTPKEANIALILAELVLPPVLTDDARLPQRLPLASRSFGFLQRPPVALLEVFLGFWVLGLFLLLVPKVVFGFLKAINVVELSPGSTA